MPDEQPGKHPSCASLRGASRWRALCAGLAGLALTGLAGAQDAVPTLQVSLVPGEKPQVGLGLDYVGSPLFGDRMQPSVHFDLRGTDAQDWAMDIAGRLARGRTSFTTGVRYRLGPDGAGAYGIVGALRHDHDPRLAGLGLGWQVRPEYGIDPDSIGRTDPLLDAGLRVHAEAAYGVLLSDGMLTPSLRYEGGDDIRLYGLGLRYQVGAFRWTYGWSSDLDATETQVARLDLSFGP